jgi:PAS domain S-box-containing protein
MENLIGAGNHGSPPVADLSRPDTRTLARAISAGLTAAIFLTDLFLPGDIAIATLYAPVVLLAASSLRGRGVLLAACGCGALTVLGYLHRHDAAVAGAAAGRLAVALTAIAITTLIALRMKLVDQQLAGAERQLRAVMDTIPTQVWSNMPDGTTDYFNRRRLDYTGPGIDFVGIVHPDDRPEHDERWAVALATGTPFEMENRLRAADGTYRWFLGRAEPQCDEVGRIVRWLGTNTDIDDLRRTEDRLRKAERDLQAAVDTIPTLIWSCHPDGSIAYFNRRRLEYSGPGVNFEDIVHPEDLAEDSGKLARSLATGESFQNEVRLRRFDGTYRWFLGRAEPQRDEVGRIVKWFGTNTDIHDRKLAEQRLRKAESELRAAIDTLRRSEAYLADAQRLSRTGTLGWRADDSRPFWSDETYRIFGYDRAMAPSMEKILDRIHPDDVEALREGIRRLLRDASGLGIEVRMVAPGGAIKHLRILARPMTQTPDEGEFIGAVTDITAARRAEEALQRAQSELAHVTRVATLGELTASIAHEVNQPLAGIVTNAEACLRWLRREEPDLDEAQHAAERIVNDGRRAGEVVRRLRALSRKDAPQHAPIDLNDVVEESLPLVHRELSTRRIVLDMKLSAGLPMVQGDRVQLQQVIINLVVNGLQAMAEVSGRPRLLRISSSAADGGDSVLLGVRDSGPGVAAAERERLFDAFYTTRPDGMGMGLSICRSIIEAHGGRIWIADDGAPGALFQFSLPVSREVRQ